MRSLLAALGQSTRATTAVSTARPQTIEDVDLLPPLTASKSSPQGELIAPADVQVLIVEDYELSRKVLSIFLRRQGYRVQSFGTGTEALNWLAISTPNAIVLDILLPDVSGLDLYERLRAMPHLLTVPVIFASSFQGKQLKEQCLARGAIAYFQKPAPLADIVACVMQALRL